jgi:hypothetical protein
MIWGGLTCSTTLAMTSTDDERKAAEKAQTVLSLLAPTTPRTDANVFTVLDSCERSRPPAQLRNIVDFRPVSIGENFHDRVSR